MSSFAPTLITVGFAEMITGSLTFSISFPFFGFTSYVVVTVLDPLTPSIRSSGEPLIRVESFSYTTGLSIGVVTIFVLAPSFL